MKTILVALDGSPRAEGVLAAAMAIARTQGSRLVLMRAIGLVGDIPKDLWRTTDTPILDVMHQRAHDYLARCEAAVAATIRGGTRVAVGSPWEAICETAKSLGADLLVVGSHGYSGIDRVIGTTAAKVVNHSPCSVLVHKDPALAERSSVGSDR